jgi:beta-lactamase class A
MGYQTRQSKRRSGRSLNPPRQRPILIFLGLILLLAVGLVWWFYHGLKQAVEETIVSSTVKLETSAQLSSTEIISQDLASQIGQLNQTLGLENQTVKAGDLPNSQTTALKLIDLSSSERSTVDLNGDVQFTSASTYKLFVAYAMIAEIEAGHSHWTSPINGTNFDDCLRQMIIVSDNSCPEAYLTNIGYSQLNDLIASLGISANTQFAPYDMRTTANDLAMFLAKLYDGQLMSQTNQQKLLELMNQQVYRQGIPAGLPTAMVYNKVGFLNNLLHDAAIVQSDSGDYILVILTNGESWEFIAGLASYLHQQMTL